MMKQGGNLLSGRTILGVCLVAIGFLTLLANQAHTSVTITDTNTNAPQPNTDPNRWLGNVYYVRTYSDGSLEPIKGREVVSLQLQDDGTWAVDNSGPY